MNSAFRGANKPIDDAPSASDELDLLIRARYPIIYVVSWEEGRVEETLDKLAKSRGKQLFVWTVTQGMRKSGTEPYRIPGVTRNTQDPVVALDLVIEQTEPSLFLFKDFHQYTCEERCNISVIRKLRDVASKLRETYKTLVIVSPLLALAPELAKDITVLDFPLPGPAEFHQLLDRIALEVKELPGTPVPPDAASREGILHAARGLTLSEAENVFAKTLVLNGKLEPDDVGMVFSEKKQVLRKSGLLEYCESTESLSQIAGLGSLKDWLSKRTIAFSDSATKFGLPAPKGVLLLGVQGCGKSLCAKAVAHHWSLPLVRFDLGRMFGSLLGSSEENIRRALRTIESIAPAVLWIDEIDKAMAGANGGGVGDGGTALRVFGTLLTWLSEKSSPVFVVATANSISHLPAELLRKGRLDEIFFVDLPAEEERQEVFRIHLQRRNRNPTDFDVSQLAACCEGFSGAEIEEAIISAMFEAFSRNVPLDTEILRQSLMETVPLSQTMREEIHRLREWAKGRARPASGASIATPSNL